MPIKTSAPSETVFETHRRSVSPGQTLRSWRTGISFLARLSWLSLYSRLTIRTLESAESLRVNNPEPW